MSQCVVDIALPHLASAVLLPDSAKKPLLRYAAIVFERLAEDRDVAQQMQHVTGVTDAILLLIRAPLACVWRNALRAALLMSYYSPASFAPLLLHANAFPQIVKMLNCDQLELRFDGIRGVRGLAQAPGGCGMLLQQPAIMQWLCRLCLSTTLPIEFEHIAATIALLLASAPEARACVVAAVAEGGVALAGEWRPPRQTTAQMVAMVQGLLADAQLPLQQQHVIGDAAECQ